MALDPCRKPFQCSPQRTVTVFLFFLFQTVKGYLEKLVMPEADPRLPSRLGGIGGQAPYERKIVLQ